MLNPPVVPCAKVSLAVPGRAGGGAKVTSLGGTGPSSSGLTAGVVVGEEGGTAVVLGASEEVMEDGWVGALDKVVTIVGAGAETETLAVGLVAGTVEDLMEVLITEVAKAAVLELIADVTAAEAS